MRTDEDFVSVVIPAYNAQTTIEETVRSVIKQTHRSLEILIVDDGSTDKTAEIVRDIIEQDSRIRLLQQKNQGVAAARNLAISQAKGDLIAVLDADDTWHPEKLARQVERLQQAGAKTGLVYCWFHVVDENGQEVSPANPCLFEGDVLPVLILFNFIGHCSGPLIRRSCIEEVGGFDASLKARGGQGCEDIALFLAIAERYEFALVPAYLVNYRQASNTISRDSMQMLRSHRLSMHDLQNRRPDLPKKLFALSEANTAFWLARRAFRQGSYRQAAYFLRLILERDPRFFFTPMAITALQRLFRSRADRPAYNQLLFDDFKRIAAWQSRTVSAVMEKDRHL